PDLGAVPTNADLSTRHEAVAQMVTRPKDPRFAKTIVNRFWKRLLGRGLFEPVDDFDSNPQNSELLDWLAYDFMSHDYDAKHTLRQILLSRVYQLPEIGMRRWPRWSPDRRIRALPKRSSIASGNAFWAGACSSRSMTSTAIPRTRSFWTGWRTIL